MNRLFTIMLRWLLHDKKRTILTLASITLSVFLISFVGFYLNAGLNVLHAQVMYEAPYHVELSPETFEQIGILDSNVAWESHAAVITEECPGLGKALEALGGGGMLPDVSVNGVSLYGSTDGDIRFKMCGGNGELIAESKQLASDLPVNAHEVVLGSLTAERFGLKAGDSITIRCVGRNERLFVGELNGNRMPVKDGEGRIIYHEDGDGSRLAELTERIERLAERGKYGKIAEILSVLYAEEHFPSRILISADDGHEADVLPPMYAVSAGEGVTLYEYTGTVKAVLSDTDNIIFFSADDTDILPFFGDIGKGDISYLTRVKKDIDAESAAINAAKGIGIYSDDSKGYRLNIDLLLMEGRQLEYIDNIAGFFALSIIIMGLFMFLARLIINNAFEISAAYRTEQYGALKTIGTSDRQIFAMIMLECAMYMLIALPAGTGLAVLVGKVLLGMIREIRLFDTSRGEGISDTFFAFKLSPIVMGVSFGCALFSVFFSAYADALRVKRMPPIRSAGYSSSKRRIKKREPWLSRRAFGYPFGFAVKCVSKQKVRFTVTLLASVISGIFIMTLGCIARYNSAKQKNTDRFAPLKYDIEIFDYSDESGTRESVAEIKKTYGELLGSGYFEEIIPNAHSLIPNDGDPSVTAVLSDSYKELSSHYHEQNSEKINLIVSLVPRENYDKYIKTDISYDDLAKSGKLLLCGTTYADYDIDFEDIQTDVKTIKKYRDRYNIVYDVLDTAVYNTDSIDKLSFTGTYKAKDGETSLRLTETVDIAGIYTTDRIEYMCQPRYLHAVLPLDSVNPDFQNAYDNGADPSWMENYSLSFSLTAKEDKKQQARSFVDTLFLNRRETDIADFIEYDIFEEKGIKAIKIAGYGFAGALAAVVLMNIFSTMSANMINRRRDLSMMRSCGMSMRQVTLSLVIESCFYAVITAAVSSVLGSKLAEAVICVYISEISEYDLISITGGFPFAGALGLFAVIMTVMAAAYVPTLAAMNKGSIAEDMRTEL